MKVLTVCNLPPAFGGAETFARALILNLSSVGIEQLVVTHRTYSIQLIEGLGTLEYPYSHDQQRDILANNIPIYPLFDGLLGRFSIKGGGTGLDSEFLEQFSNLCSTEHPEVIHCHFTTGKSREVAQIARQQAIPIVMTLHGMTNLMPKFDSFVTGGIQPEEILTLLRSVDQGVVVSDEMLEYCLSQGLSNVCRISCGIDTNYFVPGAQTKRSGILYVGKLNKHKGLKETCESFLELASVHADALFLSGRGTDLAHFQKTGFFLAHDQRVKMHRLHQQGRVHLCGELWPREIKQLYQRVRLLVLPSLTEGFPLAILEALSSGVPVVASNVGSIPEVIADGRNGYLVEPGDQPSFTRACHKALALRHPTKTCRNSIERYCINNVTERYLSLFEKVVSEASLMFRVG